MDECHKEWNALLETNSDEFSTTFQIRLPVIDSDWIDLFVGTGYYNSRPDFVLEAWRLTALEMRTQLDKFWQVISIKTDDPKKQIRLLNKMMNEAYPVDLEKLLARSKSIQVTIHCNRQFTEFLQIIDLAGLHIGPQAFGRYSVRHYLSICKTNFGVEEVERADVWANEETDGLQNDFFPSLKKIKEVYSKHYEDADEELLEEIRKAVKDSD